MVKRFKNLDPEIQKCIRIMYGKAEEARKMAYAPYSKFLVGAFLCVVTKKKGKLYLNKKTCLMAANTENASFGLTICAERNAITQALNLIQRDGLSKNNKYNYLVIVGRSEEADVIIANGKKYKSKPTLPCGACRQFIIELCGKLKLKKKKFRIVVGDAYGPTKVYTAKELLKDSFGPKDLGIAA